MRTKAILIVLVSLAVASHAAGLFAGESKLNYRADIRQIFSDNCFRCHGPDAESRESGLRLDVRASALAEADSGKVAIVPGKPDESEFIRRIESTDPDEMMPPPSSKKKLTKKQKETFRRWVADGAEYQTHWSYAPLTRPEVPSSPSGSSAPSPIDAFVLEKLASQNIQPSPMADRQSLIRRVSLDVTGLPPTPEEVAAFLADTSPRAYENLVDRLLSSPHFGERMAVWWLDVARFTDTVGFHGDQEQRIFPYRDYVIDAFNENIPFDQFTREQLAGDLLPNPTERQRIATGFNRLNMMTREGGAQPKEYLAKYGAERVRTIGTAWLGSTMGCCECHDHKYDPFTMRDFYSLQAFWADVKQWGVYQDYNYTPNPELRNWSNDHPFPPELYVDSPYLARRLVKLRAQKQQLLRDFAAKLSDSAEQKEKFATWLESMQAFVKENPTGWQQLSLQSLRKSSGDKLAQQDSETKDAEETNADGAAEGAADKRHEIQFDLPKSNAQIGSLRLHFLTADSAGKPLKVQRNEITVAVSEADKERKGRGREFFFAKGEPHEPQYFNTHEFLGVEKVFKTPSVMSGEPIRSVWQLASPLVPQDDAPARASIKFSRQGLAIDPAISPFVADDPFDTASAADIAVVQNAQANQTITPELARLYLTGSGVANGLLKDYRKLVDDIRQCRDGKAYTMITVAASKPLTVRVLPRGNWQDESGAVVEPSIPHFLPPMELPADTRATRLDLANWLCSPNNPVTSRAVMNRLWRAFFGSAISSAVDDLGAQGEAPSHPELLEWLATEFRDHGWDVKHLVRLIVLSQTYQRSANYRKDLAEIDPGNRLLAGQSPRRLDAEFVRDNALAISGLLNLELGGPSAHPYQPSGYYANLQFPERDYHADSNDNQWRRGVYMHWQRTFLHPMLANFDAPAREECVAQRVQSNTPQQALTLLNDPEFVEAARVFSLRLLRDQQDDTQRIALGYRLALAREPREAEVASLQKFLASQREYFAQHPEDAKKIVHVGNYHDARFEPIEWAAWSAVGRAILNLHETITRF
jgi:hypothetical protein